MTRKEFIAPVGTEWVEMKSSLILFHKISGLLMLANNGERVKLDESKLSYFRSKEGIKNTHNEVYYLKVMHQDEVEPIVQSYLLRFDV